MVMSQGSMPAAWMADAISRSPLLPSSLSTATRNCVRSSASTHRTRRLGQGAQKPAMHKPPAGDAHPAAVSASARHRMPLMLWQSEACLPAALAQRTEAAGLTYRESTLSWAASFSGGVHSGVKGRRHCGAVRLVSPACSSATVASAACSRSSRKLVSSHTSRSSGVVPAQ
jgi:hypothetical protein